MDSLFTKRLPIFYSVHIDGKEQTSRINSLHIQQTLNSCCDFELVETIATRKTLWQGQSQELLKQVGKNVIIRLSFPRGKNTFQFSGFITEVVIDSDTPTTTGSSENKIRIIGKGSPIVLDDSPAMNSFVDQDLKNIVEKVFKNKYFDLICNPKFKGIIPYAMQYKESRWEFLNRLSAIYNELLYFDGSKLVFGGVIDEHSDDFTIGEDITEFKVSSKTLPFKYTLYNYSAEDDEYCYSDAEDEIRPRNFYTEDVFKDYENLYQQRGMLPIEEPTHLSGDTIRLHQSKYQQALGKMHCVEGKTRNSLVRLGSLIYVKFPSLFEKENMGEYRVISVEHHVERDDYYNHFVAVPLGMEYSLYEPKTIAYPEIAEVVANNDPKKQGRVQVRFFWQKMLAEQTPWIRVQTPDAGVLTDKSGNRGFQFIPEVGDQVMVSHEGGNPHRPYVSGSMYHGKNAKEVSNNIRSITTKSGSTIVFDDEKGSVLIKDKRGSSYLLDGKGNIELNAINDFTLCAGRNISLNAQNNFVLDVGNTALMNILQKTLLTTPFMEQLIANYFHTQAGNALIHSPNQIKIEAQDTNVAGTKKIFIHSDEEATVNSKGLLSVKGEQANNISNQAESYATNAQQIHAKCLVHFRPKKGWKGEDYGFDWMRIGDTGVFGDTDYKTIVAKQKDSTGSLVTDVNRYDGTFTPDAGLFADLEKIYTYYTVPWRTVAGRFAKYYCSWLSMLPKKKIKTTTSFPAGMPIPVENNTIQNEVEIPNSVEILLKIDIEQAPDELRFEAPKGFVVSPEVIDTKGKPKGIIEIPLLITCNTPCEENKALKVYAVTKRRNLPDIKKIAGKLRIWANAPTKQKKAKMLLISVKTPPISTPYKLEGDVIGQEELFKKYLHQALIDTEVITEKVDISNPTEATHFLNTYVDAGEIIGYYENMASAPSGFINLQEYIYHKLKADLSAKGEDPNQYDNLYKAIYLGEEGGYMSSTGFEGLNGYNLGKFIVLFSGRNDQTAAHEFLHSFKLPHSFTNKEASGNADYTYTALKTENLMDYSHFVNEERYSLWKWQWKKANDSIGS